MGTPTKLLRHEILLAPLIDFTVYVFKGVIGIVVPFVFGYTSVTRNAEVFLDEFIELTIGKDVVCLLSHGLYHYPYSTIPHKAEHVVLVR